MDIGEILTRPLIEMRAEKGCEICRAMLAAQTFNFDLYCNHHPSSVYPTLKCATYDSRTRRVRSVDTIGYVVEYQDERVAIVFVDPQTGSRWHSYEFHPLLTRLRAKGDIAPGTEFALCDGAGGNTRVAIHTRALLSVLEHFAPMFPERTLQPA